MKSRLLLSIGVFFCFIIFSNFTLINEPDYPVVFDHFDRYGDSDEIFRSDSNLNTSHWANKISYIIIPEGWSISLYDHKNFCGDYISLNSGKHKLAYLGKWHNKATSLKVYYRGELQGYATTCVPKKKPKRDPADNCARC